MTILFQYLAREYAKMFAMCLSGLMTVYLVVDFFEKIRKFLRYDAELGAVAQYFIYRTPAISFQIAPLAILMATLLTLGILSRNHEITAMRSCGISLYRTSLPFVTFSLLVSTVLLSFSAGIMPLATAEAESIKTTKIEKKPGLSGFKAERPWIQIGTHALMHVTVVEPDGTTLRGITLYQLNDAFRLVAVTEAREVHYSGREWILRTGHRRTLFPDGRVTVALFDSLPIRMSQTPDDFNAWATTESEEMPLPALDDYIDRLRRDGYNATRFSVDYHSRIAYPFVCFVMTVVGIALSLRRAGVRGGGMAIGIGQALVIGFLYWTTHSITVALGRSGVLPPVIAGWMANLLFLSLGSYLFLNVRQ
jgi:lipopolysaccharide export system permease protein